MSRKGSGPSTPAKLAWGSPSDSTASTGKRKTRGRRGVTAGTPSSALLTLNLVEDCDGENSPVLRSRRRRSPGVAPPRSVGRREGRGSEVVDLSGSDVAEEQSLRLARRLQEEDLLRAEKLRMEEERTLRFLEEERRERERVLQDRRYACEICLGKVVPERP